MEPTPARWKNNMVMAIVALFALAAIAITVPHALGLNDGARIDTAQPAWTDDGIKILAIDTAGPFRRGDEVLAIDGVPMETFANNLFHPSRWQSLGEAGDGRIYTIMRDGTVFDLPVVLYDYPLLTLIGRAWDVWLMTFFLFALGVLVLWKKPDDPAARPLLLMGTGAAFSTVSFFTVQIPDIVAGWPFLLDIWLQQVGYPLMLAALVHFCLVFPQSLPLVERHRWIIPLVYAIPFTWATIRVGVAAWGGTTLDMLTALEHTWTIPTVLYFLAALLAIGMNWLKTTDAVGRQKVRWVVFAFGAHIGLRLALWNLPVMLIGRPLIIYDLLIPSTLLLPAAIAIAILRHNLFDIDLIISRTLIWTSLTILVVSAYAGIVSLIGATLQSFGTYVPSLIATGVVALLFQPARERVQRVVNRVVYGERDEPYAVVTRLGQRLEATLDPGTVLPTITETVAQALKLPYVAIVFGDSAGSTVRTAYGTPGGDVISLPLVYQSDRIGELRLASRDRGSEFSRADRRLMDDLARQIGVAAHAVRLTEELQHSRERIVTAREEERRRLRRELHDGVGPSLAAIVLRLEAARNHLHAESTEVDGMLADLKVQTQSAIVDVRRVAYDLRPPALDELGLAGAVREFAARIEGSGLRVHVSTRGEFSDLPAAVEVAAYRIAVEAITNVVRHAGGARCEVKLVSDDTLRITVSDDGKGIPTSTRPGVGQSAMRERAAELGGRVDVTSTERGVTVVAILPGRPKDEEAGNG